MRTNLCASLLTLFVCGLAPSARSADDNDAKALVDKAIQALGGEARLSAAKALTWKTKGKLRFGDNENNYTTHATMAGLDRFRQEFDGEFGGNPVKGVVVLNGGRAWRKFGDTSMELEGDALANEKRSVYLQAIAAATLLPLKTPEFKVEPAGEEKVGDADAVAIKVTAPDGNDFKLLFDKTSHLPVKVVAKVRGFGGDEFTQETTYSDFKDFDGIKKATNVAAKRDGRTFLEAELTDFKVLDQVDPETFAEPK
ncbi:MAG TPA: hypothetical protein VNH11_25625 [Pirellulales bacterium]|nr:hypothetical protein [Pirellulales bacterium]